MQMNNAYERKHNYPIVVFHGFAGFGEDELMNKFVPYFGWYNNIRILRSVHLRFLQHVGPLLRDVRADRRRHRRLR